MAENGARIDARAQRDARWGRGGQSARAAWWTGGARAGTDPICRNPVTNQGRRGGAHLAAGSDRFEPEGVASGGRRVVAVPSLRCSVGKTPPPVR